jgi:hypothetical protein
MVYVPQKGIKLASGQYLRNGQLFGQAATIATASTKAKHNVVERAADGCVVAPMSPNIALSGAAKHDGAAQTSRGMRSR